MHEAVKDAVGITTANCSTCAYLGHDDDGNYPELVRYEWQICEKVDRYQYLKSFPFKKEMSCWEPDFWHSKFAEKICGDDEKNNTVAEDFRMAVKEATCQNTPKE